MTDSFTSLPWTWHKRFPEDDRNGSIYSQPHPGHAYAVAMQPKYVENEQWEKDAAFIVCAVNAHRELVKALEDARKELVDAIPPVERLHGGVAGRMIKDTISTIDAALAKAKP